MIDLDYEFPNTLRTVGVAVSGGIESTALLALCVERYGASNVHAFSLVVQHRRSWEHEKARVICDRLGVAFHAVNFNTERMSMEASTKLHAVAQSIVTMDGWFAGGSATRFSNAVIQQPTTKQYLREQGVFLPFIGIHKPDTINILYEMGREDLIPLTHSCNQSSTACGRCSGCYERFRGFADLGILDPIDYAVPVAELFAACVGTDRLFVPQTQSAEEDYLVTK